MTGTDWTVLEIDGVTGVASTVARVVAVDWSFDAEDVEQETLIILATKHEAAREVMETGGLGLLHRWLFQRVTDYARAENRSRAVRIERLDGEGARTIEYVRADSLDKYAEAVSE